MQNRAFHKCIAALQKLQKERRAAGADAEKENFPSAFCIMVGLDLRRPTQNMSTSETSSVKETDAVRVKTLLPGVLVFAESVTPAPVSMAAVNPAGD